MASQPSLISSSTCCAVLDHVRLDRRRGADDPLDLAAALLAVTAQHRDRMLRVVHRDGVDARRLGRRQRLHDLLVGVVVRRQRIDVFQVAAVGVVGEQIAAQDQPAHLQLADLALGQGLRRGGRSGGRFGLVLPARVQRQSQPGGRQEGFFDEGAASHFRLHAVPFNCDEPNRKAPAASRCFRSGVGGARFGVRFLV